MASPNAQVELFQSVNLFVASMNISALMWAMKQRYRRPEGSRSYLRAIYLFGTVATLATLAALGHLDASSLASVSIATALYLASLLLLVWTLRADGGGEVAYALAIGIPADSANIGPYRYIRHPLYTAQLLTWFAGPLAVQQSVLFLPLLVMGWLYDRRATLEEQELLKHPLVADGYLRYLRDVGKFIPCTTGKSKSCPET
ncbi:MAG TPA: hypothetical protein VGE56_07925 [Rhodocyclaceae bacterium]